MWYLDVTDDVDTGETSFDAAGGSAEYVEVQEDDTASLDEAGGE